MKARAREMRRIRRVRENLFLRGMWEEARIIRAVIQKVRARRGTDR